MNKVLGFGVAVVALIAAAPAFAADLAPIYSPAPVIEPAPVADVVIDNSYNWTGFYAGVNGGWFRGDADVGAGAFEVDDYFLGGTVGYNFQLDNNVVVGVEGDLAWADLENADSAAFDVDWVGTLRGRAGYSFGNLLPYVTGGFALADLDVGNGVDRQLGFTAGAGLEVGVTENISLKAEYQYLDFSADNHVFGNNSGINADYNAHAIKTGVNFRF